MNASTTARIYQFKNYSRRPSRPAAKLSLSEEHRAALTDEIRRAGCGWAFTEGSRGWIQNHIRVAFSVEHIEDLADDQFEAAIQLVQSKRQAAQEFLRFMKEARMWFEKEVFGAGQPWTPSIKAGLARQLKCKVILPPQVDWLALTKQVGAQATCGTVEA
ncbi:MULTISPECIES: hypothetical protein [unclassified Pseudomonas]|uniref:hypothetical protein n=1 Tax=unclassified Pseudomonas TaxID=196821 RepID=UPI00244C5D8C|nr:MULTISPECIES: hypothetical protein [unclassified Pseudomonas]MDG9927398.1 hypothetical protein [Pseudomonas sp. GD04042]MDH0482467.1 hypothetical protein [Pseudomonas sp. GD04015]MDH0602819.1 hypothetical protein [Pseudomonas sp. GD03869]